MLFLSNLVIKGNNTVVNNAVSLIILPDCITAGDNIFQFSQAVLKVCKLEFFKAVWSLVCRRIYPHTDLNVSAPPAYAEAPGGWRCHSVAH